MIKLTIDGVCKGCMFMELIVSDWDKPTVRCKHDMVCKFVGDPNGEERYNATVLAARKEWEEKLRHGNTAQCVKTP